MLSQDTQKVRRKPRVIRCSTMDIYSPRGTKIVFAHPEAGYPHDSETAKEHLVVGKTYTVDYTDVHSSSTDVFLQEVPGVSFNSVHFDAPRRRPIRKLSALIKHLFKEEQRYDGQAAAAIRGIISKLQKVNSL